jgi:hypothetical protein
VSTASDHQLSFSTTYDITHSDDTITVSFGPEWDTNSLTIDDIGLTSGSTTLALDTTASTDTWGVNIDSGAITFTAPTDGTGYITSGKAIKVTISNGVVINPDTVGSYPVSIRILTDDGSGGQNQEAGNIEVPIIDSDQVNITGFINTFIDFDIDTGTAPFVECAYNGCQSYAGGVNANNYTVDLGELTSSTVNKSQGAAVMHAAGTSGVINSIYFDLITNAYNGAVVTVTSQHGYLQGPDLNTIASVTDGDNITANSGTYGYTLPVAGSGNGTVNRNSACQDVTHYCGVATSPSTVFDTNSKPLDYGRLRMDLAAAAAYTNNPGSYQDTLTFIATATF